ncbi:MAG: hypothetical protein HOW97_34110 [Catenulispora sp.]|nr:hypothetical protein [Catenulispora sp.]
MQTADAADAVEDIFRIVAEGILPPGQPVVLIEGDDLHRYLITEGTPLPVVIDELNRLVTHLRRHGLWEPHRDDSTPPRLRHAS